MKIEIHKYDEDSYELVIPQRNSHIVVCNKVDKKNLLKKLSDILDMIEE